MGSAVTGQQISLTGVSIFVFLRHYIFVFYLWSKRIWRLWQWPWGLPSPACPSSPALSRVAPRGRGGPSPSVPPRRGSNAPGRRPGTGALPRRTAAAGRRPGFVTTTKSRAPTVVDPRVTVGLLARLPATTAARRPGARPAVRRRRPGTRLAARRPGDRRAPRIPARPSLCGDRRSSTTRRGTGTSTTRRGSGTTTRRRKGRVGSPVGHGQAAACPSRPPASFWTTRAGALPPPPSASSPSSVAPHPVPS
jgi:hypothetical protein